MVECFSRDVGLMHRGNLATHAVLRWSHFLMGSPSSSVIQLWMPWQSGQFLSKAARSARSCF
ncbi:hypothetical protein CQY21_16065 [Mycolicibacterium boenickei]|nr:hypothetical protein CQY21_16065 [Mycolicibacterium boenickei]